MANTFTFANQTLTDANIFGGINYTADLNTGDEFTIGNTASASVKFVTNTQLPLYSKDSTNGTFTWTQNSVARGRYYITEVTKIDNKYEVTAYDAMILLDTNISALSLSLPMTVSAIATAIATYIGCTVSGTITNGTVSVSELYDDLTIRKLLGYVAEASGCSVKIDGSDHLCFMYYASSGITLTASDYISLDAADYTCAAIDNVTILGIDGSVAATSGAGTNSLFIQGNPLLYEATATEAAAILAKVSGFVYTPLKCELFDEAGLEIGVTATFGTAVSLVMHIESSETGALVSSVGSDNRAELNKSIEVLVDQAVAVAEQAQTSVNNLNQYFWYTATGAEAGAHIAEIPKDQFVQNPSGANLLSQSGGIKVRDGLDVLASFGTSGISMTDGTRTLYEVKPVPSGEGTITRVYNAVFAHDDMARTETVNIGRIVSSWDKLTVNYKINGTDYQKIYNSPSLDSFDETNEKFSLSTSDTGNGDALEVHYGAGYTQTSSETLTFVSIVIEYTTSDQTIESTLGAYADREQTGAFRVGKGTASNALANALLVDWSGAGRFGGDVVAYCDDDSSGGISLATVRYIPSVRSSYGSTWECDIGAFIAGKVAMLDIYIKRTNSIASGSNVIDLTLTGSDVPKPAATRATGMMFYGAAPLGLLIYFDSNDVWHFIIRNNSASAVTLSGGATGTLVYITE